jgi:hypothetical protein
LEREFFARLLAIDAARAEQTRVAGCGYCGGPLSVGHYERKPRGALFASAGEEFTQRFSDCCSREGCRRRATPPSVRFLGRKVYLESAILVACALVPLIDDRARVIRTATGVAARTVRRWMTWWRTVFAASALWVELRSRAPSLDIDLVPGGMLAVFEGGSVEARLEAAMRFLSPLTTGPAWRSRSSRAAISRAEDGVTQ